MEEFQVRVNLLQQDIGTLRQCDTALFHTILNNLITLSCDILNTNSSIFQDRYIPQIDNIYEYLMNKVDTFITPIEQ
jgi:hypothetical protein